MIIDGSQDDINNIHNLLNNLHLKINFTTETESNNKINYLDFTMQTHKINTRLKYVRNPQHQATLFLLIHVIPDITN